MSVLEALARLMQAAPAAEGGVLGRIAARAPQELSQSFGFDRAMSRGFGDMQPQGVFARGSAQPVAGMRAAVRDAATGRIYTGANHAEAVDAIEDPTAQARLYATPEAHGFLGADGQFLTREEGLARLGSAIPIPRVNAVGEPGANAAGTQADLLALLPTKPEQWRDAMGLHPWLDRPSRAQMAIMAAARDADGRFLYTTDDILNATGVASPESLRVQLANARDAGVPIPKRTGGIGGATRARGGDSLNALLDMAEEARRNNTTISVQALAERLRRQTNNVSSLLSHVRNGTSQRAIPAEALARLRALDDAGVIVSAKSGRPHPRGGKGGASSFGPLALGGFGGGVLGAWLAGQPQRRAA